MNRGRRHEEIFCDQEDYLRFVELLRQGSAMWNVRIAGFCLMPSHYHLLVQTPGAGLSRFMRHVDGVHTQRFNRSHKCDGPLFRGRYKAILVEADSYLLPLLRYIHRNPLRADLVSRLDRYAWSSHKAYLFGSRKWDWLHREFVLPMLCEDKAKQAAAYREFMAEAESDKLTGLFSRKNLPSILGSEGFIDWVKAKFHNLRDPQETPESRWLAPGLDAIKKAVCANYEVRPSRLLSSRRGVNNQARNVAIYLARRLTGETLAIIGKAFRLRNYSSVSSVVSRVENAMKADKRLKGRVKAIERQLSMSQEQT
ncbi:MAG: transposase [Desulfomonile tiedjei]|nr:transposase [Desulfomonile tiedjei]